MPLNGPKCELHAHLNGSLSINSMRELKKVLENAGEVHMNDAEMADFSLGPESKISLEEVFKLFGIMHRLTATPLGLKLATELVIRDFAKDNVIYLELRTTAKDNEHMNKREYLINVLEAVKNSKEVKEGKIKVKLLPSLNRGHSVQEAEEILEIVLNLKQGKYKNDIAGLDLSGDPSKGNFEQFMPVLTKAKTYGLPLALHCGEIENVAEIDLMIDFGMQRCGHGTFLNAEQRARLAKQNIATECCLSSNVLGGTSKSFEEHHFGYLFKNSYPAIICTDDCGLFSTNLTREFSLAQQYFKLSAESIHKLCENSLNYAFLSDEEKLPLQRKLNEYLKNSF